MSEYLVPFIFFLSSFLLLSIAAGISVFSEQKKTLKLLQDSQDKNEAYLSKIKEAHKCLSVTLDITEKYRNDLRYSRANVEELKAESHRLQSENIKLQTSLASTESQIKIGFEVLRREMLDGRLTVAKLRKMKTRLIGF